MLGEGILKGLAETARNFLRQLRQQRSADHRSVSGRTRAPDRSGAQLSVPRLRRRRLASRACAASPARSAKRNARPSASSSKRARTRSRTTSGKPQFYPAVFNIDVSVCMSCQICVEVCPFDAIKMDTAFELSTDDRFGGLLWNKEQLAKSNEYYHQIHPTEAAAVDARLAEGRAKLEAKPKPTARCATRERADRTDLVSNQYRPTMAAVALRQRRCNLF